MERKIVFLYMQHIQGISRHQLQLSSLEDKITADNPVRFVYYTDLIGLEKVNGEHSLIMLVYNIKRSINILGVPDLIAKLHKWNSSYKRKDLFLLKTTYLQPKLDFVYKPTPFAA